MFPQNPTLRVAGWRLAAVFYQKALALGRKRPLIVGSAAVFYQKRDCSGRNHPLRGLIASVFYQK